MRLKISNTTLDAIEREACQNSFFEFMVSFWSVIEESKPIWNWHIKYLCNEIQTEVENYFKESELIKENEKTNKLSEKELKKIIDKIPKANHIDLNICPGTTKSTTFSRLLTAWIWTKYPQATVINITRDSNNAKNFATKSKEVIESEKYKRLFPEVEIKQTPSGYLYFENNHNGKRYALTSLSSGTTGKHADIVVLDDFGAYIDYASEATVEQLENALDGIFTRFKDKGKGVIFNVMQRLAYNDTTAYLFEGYEDRKPKLKGRVKRITLPADTSHDNIKPKELIKFYKNGLLDPIRLSEQVLREQKDLFLGANYDSQYGQITTLNEDDLMYPHINERDFNIQEQIESDFANVSVTDLKDEGKDSYATIITTFSKEGWIYVLDVIYNHKSRTENENKLITLLKSTNCTANFVESNNQVSYINTTLTNQIFNLQPYHSGARDNKILKIKDNSHLMAYVIWHSNHPNPEYQKALSHIKRFPRNGKAKDDGIEDVFSVNMRYYIEGGYVKFLKNVA